jgi:hypothetical protein
MRHFEVIGETGQLIGEIWAADESAANAIADAIYPQQPHFLRAAFTWEQAHAA